MTEYFSLVFVSILTAVAIVVIAWSVVEAIKNGDFTKTCEDPERLKRE